MPQKPHQKLITKVGGISVKRGWLRLFVVELIISVSLSGVLIVISCFFWMQLETQPEQRTQYCMPCLSISLNADEDNKNFGNFSIQQGDYLQCCSAADGVPKLVELSIEKKRRHTIASGFISGVPRSCELFDDQTITQGYAKVVGFTASARGHNIQESYLTILHWNKESILSFIGNDIEYRNGSLVIGRSAYYTVYSQIMFNQSLERDDEDEFKTFVHLIYKHTDHTDPKYDLRLLESSKSLCQPKSTYCTGSSYISSVFFLRKSDEITVRVNSPTRILPSPYGNFFGIYPVS
ncbi:hypothetical protein CHS0354_009351 [Potamilus streckersoni]|uniref:THD domain-containing protein n=1 Tax=Potamilus streckersoni TaxID=2493646 RepID=A0AAE0TF50_9BIVA|nr:hypothetical protein CHS0354_009351 [Potamilus streckersoni]